MGKRVFMAILIIVAIVAAVFGLTRLSDDKSLTPSSDENQNVQSGEVSGETQYSEEEYSKIIDEYVSSIGEVNRENSNVQTVNLTDAELGEVATEFMNSLQVTEIPGEVLIHDSIVVTVIPASDFLDIQSYYYSGDELVMYVCEFTGIGGRANYYFDNSRLISVKTQIEEEMDFEQEKESKILERAKNIYEKYIVNKESEVSSDDKYSVELSNGKVIYLGQSGDLGKATELVALSTNEYDTDWPGIKLRKSKYQDFEVTVLVGSTIEEDSIMRISTSSSNLKIGSEKIKIGDTLLNVQEAYKELKPLQTEYDPETDIQEFDSAYIDNDETKPLSNEIIFYFKNDVLVGVTMSQPIDA